MASMRLKPLRGTVVSGITTGLFFRMHTRREHRLLAGLPVLLLGFAILSSSGPRAASLPTPEQFIGFKDGADNKLARWDRVAEYMKVVGTASDRVNVRELGKSTAGNPFLAIEISSPENLKNLERQKQLARKLYF